MAGHEDDLAWLQGQWRAVRQRAAEAEHSLPGRVRSKCINCGKHRACIKIEARAPLSRPVVSWSYASGVYERVDYEADGPMVEICRACLKADIGTLAHHLLEGLTS